MAALDSHDRKMHGKSLWVAASLLYCGEDEARSLDHLAMG